MMITPSQLDHNKKYYRQYTMNLQENKICVKLTLVLRETTKFWNKGKC